MRRAIVCTGLIRNPEKFNAFLDAIASLDASARADLTVLFSTWVNELDAYPEIRQRLRALSCIIIEQGAPDLTLSEPIRKEVESPESDVIPCPLGRFVGARDGMDSGTSTRGGSAWAALPV